MYKARKAKSHTLRVLSGALALLTLGGCADPYLRQQTADRLGSPAWMIQRTVKSEPFGLVARERMHKRFAPARVYIEGDGFDISGRYDFPVDPTPENPVALHLATRDKAQNVVYIARPYQYRFDIDREDKNPRVWGEDRFSPEVLASFNSALDDIKRRYDITGFDLVGYEGGGAIAALLAAGRSDILSLRTVAGTMDQVEFTNHYGMRPYEGSLNAADIAQKLTRLPQVHYIGGQDRVTPASVLYGYLQALGPTPCERHELIQEAAHETGWVDKWPQLLAEKPTCTAFVPDETLPVFEEKPEPFYSPREVPEKP